MLRVVCSVTTCATMVTVDAATFAAVVAYKIRDDERKRIMCDECKFPRPPHVGSISHRHYEPGDEALPSQESAIRAMEDGPCSE